MPPPPPLPEELLEEIFLRLPPDEPACLVRASFASKLWLALLTGPAFRGRYGDFHGSPPMLGFLLSFEEKHPALHFVSTAKFAARIPDCLHGRVYVPLDCRHGRVLLEDVSAWPRKFSVWDPMTGCQRELGAPVGFFCLGAAVLCAVTGCDHRACHHRGGPFRVLLFGLSLNDNGAGSVSAHARLCSSETEQWSQPCPALHLASVNSGVIIVPSRSVLLQNALYHMVCYLDHIAILKYDIGSNCMSLLDGPPLAGVVGPSGLPILMALEDATLGFAYLGRLVLYLQSRLIRSDGIAAWTLHRVVDLKELLPIQNPKKKIRIVGFKEDSDIIFVTTELGIYEINLKKLECNKLWKEANIRALIPYMSFYNPPERAATPWKVEH